MPGLELPTQTGAGDVFEHAQKSLSGKRIALVGFSDADSGELARIIAEANAFTRSLSAETGPSADVLKPFELILVNVESAKGTLWASTEEAADAMHRCVAVGSAVALLNLAVTPSVPYREFCIWPASAEGLLLRCVLALRSSGHAGSRPVPLNSTVVLADDDASITALVRLALQRNGMTCETASNGGEALKLIQQLRPGAVVLDVGMPDMDGFEVLSRIRSTPELAQTGVILLTGCEQETDILRGFRLGADDYVIKPFNPMELMMRLKRVIGRI